MVWEKIDWGESETSSGWICPRCHLYVHGGDPHVCPATGPLNLGPEPHMVVVASAGMTEEQGQRIIALLEEILEWMKNT